MPDTFSAAAVLCDGGSRPGDCGLTEGARIRIRTNDGQKWTGKVEAITADTLMLQPETLDLARNPKDGGDEIGYSAVLAYDDAIVVDRHCPAGGVTNARSQVDGLPTDPQGRVYIIQVRAAWIRAVSGDDPGINGAGHGIEPFSAAENWQLGQDAVIPAHGAETGVLPRYRIWKSRFPSGNPTTVPALFKPRGTLKLWPGLTPGSGVRW